MCIFMNACVHVPLCACTLVSMYLCVHIPLCACTSVCIYLCVHVHLCACSSVCLNLCVHLPLWECLWRPHHKLCCFSSHTIYIILLLLVYLFVCICVCSCMRVHSSVHVIVHLRRSESNLWASLLSLYEHQWWDSGHQVWRQTPLPWAHHFLFYHYY